jgi:hypothetical protein
MLRREVNQLYDDVAGCGTGCVEPTQQAATSMLVGKGV